jgi:hypothetical protein
MNRITKMAIAMAGFALAVQGAIAGVNNNNLVLSINNNSGGGTTEFTVNLGQISTFAGPNYDLSSFLSTFNSQYASAGASGLNVGVAGGQNGQGGLSGAGNDVFTTTLRIGNGQYTTAGTEGAPSVIPTKANIANAGSVAAGTISFGSNQAIGDSGTFTSVFAKDPLTPGTATPNFTGSLGGDNPLQQMTGSTISLDLWKDTVTSTGTTSWVYQGDFTLDLSGATPSLIWDAAAPVPEPATYGLCAGAGLLVLSLRRQLRSKNA